MDYKKTIMRKIYLIWMFRKIFNVTVAKVVAIFVLVWQLTAYVSFANVVRNLPSLSDFSASYSFFESAVVNTEITTQVLMVAILMLGFFLVRDVKIAPENF